MEAKLEDNLSSEELEKMFDVLSKAFDRDDLINKVFLDHVKSRRLLIKLTSVYYAHYGHIFVCRDKNTHEIVGAAVWADENYHPLTIPILIFFPYVLFMFLWLILTDLFSMLRLMTVSDEIERRRPKRKDHAYLYIIGSIRPGAGSLLMAEAEKFYGDKKTLYLECSDPKVNEKFYGKFGFQNVGYMEYAGIQEGFMIRPGEGVTADEYLGRQKSN